MVIKFPIQDVDIEFAQERKEVDLPLYCNENVRINQHEFSMEVENVAYFYVSYGNYISICKYPGCEINELELYLNGSVYGAVLHQRKLFPLHGSSFIENGAGVVLCGESGVGKSSLTASFCIRGSDFLTDDITPIIFEGNIPFILGLSDRIKLWDNALLQLNLKTEGLEKIDQETEKFYYPIVNAMVMNFKLDFIYILSKHDNPDVDICELRGVEKVTAIRSEIYRIYYLHGMPENEFIYFKNIVDISNNVRVFKIFRPESILINNLMELIKKHIDALIV